MSAELESVTKRETVCKCCGTTSPLYGVVDFHKNCEVVRGKRVLPLSGVPVYYHRCPTCEFIFTTAFDHFTPDDFARHVYNEQYPLVDPDYKDARPRANAAGLAAQFASQKPNRLLDYGGGGGLLAELLRRAGFPQADTYDPFVPEHCALPDGRYECVVSFEVLEHTPDPMRTFREMSGFLNEPGLMLFSTLVQPANIDQIGLSWWYAAPRNGHVSLYSRSTLQHVARTLGFTFGSFNDNVHAMFRELPQFAKHLVRP